MCLTNQNSISGSGSFTLQLRLTSKLFRAMDLERRIFGVAYIGRIKSFDDFKCEDELFGIVYKGESEVDYNLFASICNTHNNKYFYSMKVNKNCNYFTMRECLATVKNFPMVGKTGISSLDKPMSFAEFGRLAYSESILDSKTGYDVLCGDINKQITIENYTNVDENKNASTETIPSLNLVEHEEVISGNPESGYTNVTMDTLKEKCAMSDSMISDLNGKLTKKEVEIETLKTQLQSLNESNTQFMSAADLQEARSRAIRADSASEVVEGLKGEFALLKGLSNKVASMAKDINKQKDNHETSMKLIADCFATLHNNMVNSFLDLKSTIDKQSTLSNMPRREPSPDTGEAASRSSSCLVDASTQTDSPSFSMPTQKSANNPTNNRKKVEPWGNTEGFWTQNSVPYGALVSRGVDRQACGSHARRESPTPNWESSRHGSPRRESGSSSQRGLPRRTHYGSPGLQDGSLSFGGSSGSVGSRGLQPGSSSGPQRASVHKKGYLLENPYTNDSMAQMDTQNRTSYNMNPRPSLESIWEHPPPSLKRSSEYAESDAKRRS